MYKTFKAITVEEKKNGEFFQSIVERNIDHLPKGDLLVRVKYSSLNYKDSLSYSGNKGVTKIYPHTPGIDAMGVVELSKTKEFNEGDKVIVTGYDLGMNTPGGFGEYISVPKEWVTLLPDNLGDSESMILGTAGITAGLCVNALLEKHKIKGEKAVVTGSTGGVGCIAVMLLAKLGAEVTAITGKTNSKDFLYSIGAKEVLLRNNYLNSVKKPMSKGVWDIALDVAGGRMLAGIIASMKYGGTVTCCGLVDSPSFTSSVFPFILRGINLIGIDSAEISIKEKAVVWHNFANHWRLDAIQNISNNVDMYGMMDEIKKILEGRQVGRVVLKHK